MTGKEKDIERWRKVGDLLYAATKPIRILSHLGWGAGVREEFFKKQAKELPVVVYPEFDGSETLGLLQEARGLLSDSQIDQWFLRIAYSIETSAKMLGACGTMDFYQYSKKLYGEPQTVLPDNLTTPHALACRFSTSLSSLKKIDLGAPPPACHLSQAVADAMKEAALKMFADESPEVLVVDDLSANALAGPRRIRIRRKACFTDKDVDQLIHHEAHIHVATSLNGLHQHDLKILGAGHPGTTKTQEGLAVFSEFITGSIDLDRMLRLSDRVVAIQMSVEGADFLEVYKFFLEKTGHEEQSFENTRRVFRGGVLQGGAPFTKDLVYLDGLLRVHHFMQAVVDSGRADCLRLLFCGKLDIDDLPILVELKSLGLCREPKFLPPWAKDLRFLLCFLTFSAFTNDVDFNQIKSHYGELLAKIPVH